MDKDVLPDDAPFADVDAWLREHLGRRLTVAFVSPVAPAIFDQRIEALMHELAVYPEMRVAPPELDFASGRQLDALVALDPEVVLVVDPQHDLPAGDESAGYLRALFDELEGRGVLDRAFVALVGPRVTREDARRLGFEDGFSEIPPPELASILAREGVAVDERRRRGSSPPCYL